MITQRICPQETDAKSLAHAVVVVVVVACGKLPEAEAAVAAQETPEDDGKEEETLPIGDDLKNLFAIHFCGFWFQLRMIRGNCSWVGGFVVLLQSDMRTTTRTTRKPNLN